VNKLLEIGSYKYNNEVEYFEYVIDKYFRKIPPIPTNIYLNQSSASDVDNRVKLASVCHFPSIINTLARDENYYVRDAARKNEFWVLVGQLQDVLGFEKRERREFARQEVFRIIVVMLMFEDDLDVLREVLRNASISTHMLTRYIEYLEKRGHGKRDEQILSEARSILEEKKQRIVKVAGLQKARKDLKSSKNQESIIQMLADVDLVMRRAVHNLLQDISPDIFYHLVHVAIDKVYNDEILKKFTAYTELINLVIRRDDLRVIKVKDFKTDDPIDKDLSAKNIKQYITQLLTRHRLELLDKCQEDLTDFQSIQLLTTCHCDLDDKIRKVAENIISLEDIFALIDDVSTPQHIFKSILNALSEHPDERVQKRVASTYLEESERLRNKLKELEQSITAYFDIIFNSVGFPQINEYNVSIQTIEQAEKTIENLTNKFDKEIQTRIEESQSSFSEIKKAIEMEIYKINSDVSADCLEDISYLADMTKQIIALKNFGKQGMRPSELNDIDLDLLNKANTIWQSALGPFLGRIKHLNEMVKIKFSILAKNFEKHGSIQNDFVEVVETYEQQHKDKINCKLTIACNQCSKRSCAAERFLNETDFFIEELIDNFIPQNG
jgi:hypothetical protein